MECGSTLSFWLFAVLEQVVHFFHIQVESRMVLLICFPLYHCPKYHLVDYSLPSHIILPSSYLLSKRLSSPKPCGSKSGSTVCSQAFSALLQANLQCCLATLGSLDTALMGIVGITYLFPTDLLSSVMCEALCWFQEKYRNEC